jgi:hypothetical protein
MPAPDIDIAIMRDVVLATHHADIKFPDQHLPGGTAELGSRHMADFARQMCQVAAGNGTLTWRHVLTEEYHEALAEKDEDKLLGELAQIAAVCVRWMRDIHGRQHGRAAAEGHTWVHGHVVEYTRKLYDITETFRRGRAGLPTTPDQWDGHPILWFDKKRCIPCGMPNEIHREHGNCPGVDDPDVPATDAEKAVDHAQNVAIMGALLSKQGDVIGTVEGESRTHSCGAGCRVHDPCCDMYADMGPGFHGVACERNAQVSR